MTALGSLLAGSLGVVGVGAALALFAFLLRVAVHLGATPGGVDTWYYLASADELRRTRRLPIHLPQYLLQDESESYPPGFVLFLALFPRAFLRRYFWVVSPVADVLNLLVLYGFVYRLTDDLAIAALAGFIYALVPQLIADTRSLSPRALGVLVSSIAMLLVLRAELPTDVASSLHLGAAPLLVIVGAVLAIAVLFLTQPTGGIALGVGTFVLAVTTGDVRYLAYPVAGLVAAFVLSGGLYARVLMNHVHAIRFWRRNARYRDAEPIMDSPIYGSAGSPPAKRTRWRSLRWQVLRLAAENPFTIPMVVLPPPDELWGQRLYWWGIAVLGWAIATTLVPPLRAFGPGYIYLKAASFPIAVSLALAVGPRHVPIAPLLAAAVALSLGAIAFFYRYVRSRPTERTSSLPAGLAALTVKLQALPAGGVLVLPTMYADYVCYNAGKSVLWGGHSGDLSRFEKMAPVVRVPLQELISQYRLGYALLDLSYVTPEQLRLQDRFEEIARERSFVLFRIRSAA